MTGLGHQKDGADALLAEVSEGAVPELVQRGATAGVGEDLGGTAVGQPSTSSRGVEVGQCDGPAGRGWPLGEEQRPTDSPGDDLGQEPCAAAGEVDHVGVAAFAADDGSASGGVQVLDIEVEDLVGSGGAFVEEAPEAAVADGGISGGEEPVEVLLRQGLAVVLRAAAAFKGAGEVVAVGDPVVPLAEGCEGAQRGDVPVPGVGGGARVGPM